MNTVIKAIIIEDNIEASDYLFSLIVNNFTQIEIVACTDNVKEAVHKINSLKPEILFMDIELKDGNAFEILDAFENSDFEVIFITAYDSYLEKAMEHYAFYYILKPVELSKLEEVIKKYLNLKERMFSLAKYKIFSEFMDDRFSKLLIHVNCEYVLINLKDVIKCEAEGNYTFFFLSNENKLLASNTLKYYDELLTHKGFFRAHRSVLVNISHIKSIYKREALILSNRDKVIVSQRKRSNLSSLINSFS